MPCMLQVNAGSSPKRLPTLVCVVTVFGSKENDSTLLNVTRHLSLFRPLNNPFKVLLGDFTIGRGGAASPL